MRTGERPARGLVLAAGLCGQLSVAASGVLPLWLLPVAALLLPAAVVASAASHDPSRVRLLRRGATGLAVGLVVLAAPRLTAGDTELRGVLGPLLVGVQVAQALVWQVRRDLQVGLLVALGLLVLGASYAPDLVAGVPLLLAWPICLLAFASLVRLREDEVVEQVGRRLPVAMTAGAMALGLVVWLLVPVPKGPGLRGRLGIAAATTRLAGRAADLGGGPLDLRVRGTLSDLPVARVDSRSPALWGSATYSRYDGQSWTGPGLRSLAGPPYVLPARPGEVRSDEVTVLSQSRAVWAPGRPVSLRVDVPVQTDGAGGLALTRPTSSYAVTSVLPETRPDLLRAADATGDDPAQLQLPERLPARVRALAAQLTAGRATRYDAVRAVEQWLGSHADYRLDSPVPAPGEDAVDRFLFVDRTGFCEQFAAAEAVLLRAAGIPARVVTGLAYGTAQGSGQADRLFREKDLHAWVEVSYGSLGWSPSDPTAGAVAAAVTSSLRARVSARLASALRLVGSVPGGRPALAAGLVLLVLAGTLAPRRPGRRPRRTGPTAPAGELLAAFHRLDDRLGPRCRRPAESLEEMACRLGLAGSQAAAFQALQRECYAPPPGPGAGAAAVLDRMAVAP